MTIREIGVAHASGFTTYFSLDQSRTLSFYRRQGSRIEHKEIDDEIRARIAAQDDRMFVAIIQGDIGFMLDYRLKLNLPDLIVYVSTPELLRQMNIQVIDESWERGDEKIDLNLYLPRRT